MQYYVHSKILIEPKFKQIPQTTLANVQDNITNWQKRGFDAMVKTFCRKDSAYPTGYRFIRTEDLDETIITEQIIAKVKFTVTWHRRLHTADHLCPLYFSHWYMTATLKHKDYEFDFKSDNNLRINIRIIKSNN